MNRKDRRKSGWVRAEPTAPLKLLRKYETDYFLFEFYDDWNNYRDGQRDLYRDGKLIKSLYHPLDHWDFDSGVERDKRNKKQYRLLRRRKQRKAKYLNRSGYY